MRFLAQELGVSPATVSIVLNNSPLASSISEQTKNRVWEAIEKFDYRPNFLARCLSNRRSYTIAVVVPEVSDGYSAHLLNAIEESFIRERYFYIVASHRSSPEMLDACVSRLRDRAVEGFIFVNTPLEHAVGLPAVHIAGHKSLPNVTNIVLDNYAAADLAVKHLTDLGHRHIAMFKGQPGSADTEDRYKGVCQAFERYGVKVDADLTIQLQGTKVERRSPTHEEGYEYAKRLLSREKRFTALVAFNDISAIGAIRAFHDAGLRVPGDVSVVGFDDIEEAAYTVPGLTTIRQPLREMGELAAVTVLDRIAGKRVAKTIGVNPQLIVRGTTQAAK